jgi:hypothetical protein
MPVKTIELDGSVREEDVTLLLGKNIILKLVEDRKTEQLLSRPEVKVLLKTEDLCHKSLVEKMNLLLELLKWSDLEDKMLEILVEAYEALPLIRPKEKKTPTFTWRNIAKKFRDHFFKIVKERDQKIIELEERVKDSNHDLIVTRPSVMFSCPRCKAPVICLRTERFELQLGEFNRTMKCFFCKTLITREEVNRHPIHEIIPTVEEVWRTGLWLEEYLASILRSLEWQTWTRVSMLGTSGIRHEVDLLAIKRGFILVGECKTGKVSREDVFTFSTKMSDLRSHFGLFGLLRELPETETREFMNRNPALILLEKMCELKRKDLIERLQSSIGKI